MNEYEQKPTVVPHVNPIANFPLTLQGVIYEILDRYEVRWNVILSRKRTARVSDARHLIAAFLAWHSSLSLVEIGALLGGRDHGTIIHSRRKISDLYRDEIKVQLLIEDLEYRHLQIDDHSAIVRDRAVVKTSSGFVLPGSGTVPTERKPRKRTADGRRVMTDAEIRRENHRLRERAS